MSITCTAALITFDWRHIILYSTLIIYLLVILLLKRIREYGIHLLHLQLMRLKQLQLHSFTASKEIYIIRRYLAIIFFLKFLGSLHPQLLPKVVRGRSHAGCWYRGKGFSLDEGSHSLMSRLHVSDQLWPPSCLPNLRLMYGINRRRTCFICIEIKKAV